MKIQQPAYTPPKNDATVRPANAKAEEKTTAVTDTATAARPDTDVVALGNTPEKPVTYTPPKKLTADQVKGIKEMLSAQQNELLQAMAGNSVNQANSWLQSLGQKTQRPWSNAGASAGNKLPPLATTQEGALAAISEGGAYSVDAVATRIFDMAKSMAGDDPAMLEKMRDAVKKGFAAAGVDFKKATGQGLPSISSQTYDEVMKRFDERFAELGVKKEK